MDTGDPWWNQQGTVFFTPRSIQCLGQQDEDVGLWESPWTMRDATEGTQEAEGNEKMLRSLRGSPPGWLSGGAVMVSCSGSANLS